MFQGNPINEVGVGGKCPDGTTQNGSPINLWFTIINLLKGLKEHFLGPCVVYLRIENVAM